MFSSFHTLGPAAGLRKPGGGAWCSEWKLAGIPPALYRHLPWPKDMEPCLSLL